ncbi:MAG TPA: hypothetical protein VF340_09030 [Methyloceanibacter sp.]
MAMQMTSELGKRLLAGDAHRAHHESGDVVAHALLFRWRGLELGRLVRGRGTIAGSGGLSAVGRFPVAILLWLTLIASLVPLIAVSLIVVSWLALPLMIVLALVPHLGVPSIALSRVRLRGRDLLALRRLGLSALA